MYGVRSTKSAKHKHNVSQMSSLQMYKCKRTESILFLSPLPSINWRTVLAQIFQLFKLEHKIHLAQLFKPSFSLSRFLALPIYLSFPFPFICYLTFDLFCALGATLAFIYAFCYSEMASSPQCRSICKKIVLTAHTQQSKIIQSKIQLMAGWMTRISDMLGARIIKIVGRCSAN